ncbi:hypothetical protein Q7P37_009229 [Cladosporium fusiforme]
MDRRNSVAILDKMSKDWEIHPNRLAVSKPIAKGGVFFAENHEWLVNRKLGIRNVGFGTKRARNAESLESDVEMLFEAIGDAGEDGWTECVDLADLLYRATGDMISHQLLGVRANTQLEYINEKVDGTQGATSDQVRMNAEKAYILHMLGKRSKMGQWNFLGDGLKFRAACRNFKRSVDGIIQQALDRSHAASLDQADAVDIAQNSLISGLANSTADAQRIRDVVVDMLVAGEQASGTVLAFLVANLERQPELFNDVRKEILDTFGTEQNPKGVINWDRLKSCNLLQWCILEALRLFGPVGVIARQSRRDTVLPHGGGPDGEAPLAVPRGAGVIIFTSLIHQRVDYWGEDAETFKPRRWEERKFGSEWAAFGQGARLCIGQQISMTQMSYVFARLLQHYSSLEAPDPGDNLRKAFGNVNNDRAPTCRPQLKKTLSKKSWEAIELILRNCATNVPPLADRGWNQANAFPQQYEDNEQQRSGMLAGKMSQDSLKHIEELCSSKSSISASYALESEKSPGEIAHSLFQSDLLQRSTHKAGRELRAITKNDLDFARRCGNFEGTQPSDLFLSAYYGSLLCLDGDPLANCCSPSLCGSTGIVPMAVIGSIHDQLRHVSNLIARAEHEVLLASNFWKASKSSTFVSDALRELSRRSQARGRTAVVKIIYDRGAASQIFNSHQNVGPQGWTNVNVGLPAPEEVPGIDLKVVNFHKPPLGTFHPKFMVVDRCIATVSSNNIQDNDNLEMTTHFEGAIVNGLWETFLVSWHNLLEPALPCREQDPFANENTFPICSDIIFSQFDLNPAGQIGSTSETSSTDLQKHCAGAPQYDSSVGEEILRMQATLYRQDETSRMDVVAKHLSDTTNSGFRASVTPDSPTEFFPFVAMHMPEPVPMALVSRKPYQNLNNQSSNVPQNEAFLSLIENAKHNIFIQTPDLNAKDLLPALAKALERGVEITYYVCLGYNDAGEMLPGQGGINEQAAGRLFRSLQSDEAKARLNIFFYVAADQTEPKHKCFGQRSCHIKLLIADGQVAIQGSGNQDTQSWYHSQEVNVMVDSPDVCKVWREGIERNQNTARYGRVREDGFWYDENGKLAPGTNGSGGGVSSMIHGMLGMLQKARGE